jgi:hypothetical protein
MLKLGASVWSLYVGVVFIKPNDGISSEIFPWYLSLMHE